MVVKTDLCNFSEWKIYPGKGVRFVAKDGRPFLFLSKRNRNFGLRYFALDAEKSKPRDSDGPPHGGDCIRKLNKPRPAKLRERETTRENRREPLRASLSTPSTS